jgi:hypothetical protein
MGKTRLYLGGIDMIIRPTEIKQWFCVWDGNYGDFIDSFDTLEDARNYCKKAIKGNPKCMHHYKIGKWISPETDDFELLEEVKWCLK